MSTEKFLNLEEKASQIVDELNALRNETGTYASASNNLETATSNINQLASSVQKSASELSELSKSIRETGFTEVINGIAKVEKQISDSHHKTKNLIFAGLGVVVVIQIVSIIVAIAI